MSPDICVLLNVDEDHLSFFKTLDNIKKAFRTFAELTSSTVIYNGDDANTLDALKGLEGKKMISVGLSDSCEWQAKNVYVPGGFHIEYDAYHNDMLVAHVVLPLPGEHNVLNSLCAFVAAYESGAPVDKICAALAHFGGAGRRFELLGTYCGVTFADDYAHHPTEIHATISTAKKYPHHELWVVFQSHTYTRTKALMHDFAKELAAADHVICAEIYPARETDNLGISGETLAAEIRKEGTDCYYFPTFKEIEKFITDTLVDNDLLITMGAGDVVKIGDELLKNS